MSFSASDSFTISSLGADAGIPGLNVADIPTNVRDGDQQAREAYVEGLAFEDVLVNQLTQQMSSTLSGSTSADGGSSYSSSYDGSSSSEGSGFQLAGASAFSSMIPQALTQGIMDGGGLGIADEFAAELDPSLNAPAPTASSGGDTGDSTNSGSTGGVAA